MASILDIEGLKRQFRNKEIFSVKDIEMFYKEKEPSILMHTISWRIYKLVQNGTLQRTGRGLYSLGSTSLFSPVPNDTMIDVGKIISGSFPFINYCQWESSYINYFSQHLINFNITFLDVEREVMEPVYFKLKEEYIKVIQVSNLYDNISEFDDFIILRPLISGSPVQKTENTITTTIEKLLVDLYSDKEFNFLQGNEIYTIFDTAFDKYTVNINTMLRYAGRKNRRDNIRQLLKTINRQ